MEKGGAIVSEAAYYHDHRVQYGCAPDEDSPFHDPDMEGMDFRCPKCNDGGIDDESGMIDGEKVCLGCIEKQEDAAAKEVKLTYINGYGQRKEFPRN